MAELDLIARDLDQLEAALPAGGPAAAAWTGPATTPVADEIVEKAADAAKSTVRSVGVLTALVLALVLAGAGASAFFATRSDPGSGRSADLRDPVPVTSAAPDPSTGTPTTGTTEPGGAAYALTGRGIRAFLDLYRTRFGTSQVIDLTLYGDYVVVDVPVPGKPRHAGWFYRTADGFTGFGGVTSNFPGAVPVDTDRLAIPALVRNIARARSTLNVEDPTTTYVIVRYYGSVDRAPTVDIHVSNDVQESGYLATTLDGTVERAHPFGQ